MKKDHSVDETYFQNEVNANKEMTKVCVFMAIVLSIIYAFYVSRLFPIRNPILIYIVMPIDIILLLTTLYWSRTKMVEKPGYKFFVVYMILLVVGALATIIPKHVLLGWAVVILTANHYYSRRFCTHIFVAILIMMFITIYAGMFFGEYDPQTLGDGIVKGEIYYPMDAEGKYYLPDTPQERFEMLHREFLAGENRYVKVWVYYYIPRSILLTIIYFSSMGLNYRTYNLLKAESKLFSDKEKMVAELNVASELQLTSLPQHFIDDENINIFGNMYAAKEVGGDFFDYIIKGDDLWFIIGDVSGKGVNAY